MTLDIPTMVRIAESHYGPAIANAFGDEGADALRTTLSTIRELYGHVEPEMITGTLVVVHPVLDDGSNLVSDEDAGVHAHAEALAQAYGADARSTTSVVVILPNGYLHLRTNVVGLDAEALSRTAIVYHYSNGQEFFVVDSQRKAGLNPSKGVHLSTFSIPTFRQLEDALEAYRIHYVRPSRCPVFLEVWEDGTRLVFRNKPEATMRRSLAHYLSVALRGDAEVHQEKVVDESHPVDVEVTWPFAKRVAIIEIKWLGDSRTPSGKFTSYRDARANEGAQQLAEYLDAKAAQSPTHDRTGYLVVIDGRRGGLTPETTSITTKEAMAYAKKGITFTPAYHEERDDFAEPVRMFAEPTLAACKSD